jgi:hypothetical protein
MVSNHVATTHSAFKWMRLASLPFRKAFNHSNDKMDEVCSFLSGGAYFLRHFSLGV